MGVKDKNYKVVYRGEALEIYEEGAWVFFQRSADSGGGFWLGRTYNDCFWLEFDRLCSLSEGIKYLLNLKSANEEGARFDDEFELL